MLFRLMNEKGKYQTVYFAFVDILGFTNLLREKCKKNPNYLLSIISEANSSSKYGSWHGINQIFLSDSILMWTSHKNAIPFLLENCERIQHSLFLKGHLARGVIIKDKHFTGDSSLIDTRSGSESTFINNVIVSPALVRAYNKEREITEPVILCEGAVLNDLPKVSKAKGQKRLNPQELYGFGNSYLEHFRYLATLLDSEFDSELKKEFKHIIKLRDMVEKEIKSNQRRAKEKWQYVGRIFNRCFASMSKKLKAKKLKVSRIKIH